ncbi:MAG: glycoside hydrolase family 2 [Bacteroidales bacterium]|nr:glycoside hydrolase family 2 [Bacteroidales bacterium]
MRKTIICAILLAASLGCWGATVNGRQAFLHEGWSVFPAKGESPQAVSSEGYTPAEGSYPATVPSTVMGVLTRAGLFPGILEGDNYSMADPALFESPWWYRTEFDTPLSQGRILLQLDGVSYSGEIWLNGRYIDTLEGPFRRCCYDITEYAREHNVLAISVSKAGKGQPGIGFVDWNPRPADGSMGLYREVSIIRTGDVAMQHSTVRSKVDGAADLTVETTLVNLTGHPVEGVLTGCLEGRRFSKRISLEPAQEQIVLLDASRFPALHIDAPRLWWCNGMGSPQMYSMDLVFITSEGISDSQKVDFGIRTVEQYLNEDGNLAFKLNGRPVLLRGAGWTDDIFLRDDPKSNERQIAMVKDMNLNLVRFEEFWGTSENIYDLCDRAGLMVLAGWSCFWEWEAYLGKPHDPVYGGILTPDDIALTAKSFEDQVLWLRSHPSILAWFTGSDRIPHPDLEPQYLDFLSGRDDRKEIISASGLKSPVSGPSGTKMRGPYEYVGPVYWYSPEAPGYANGFNTETSVGASLPVKESIAKMGLEWPADAIWDKHCTVAAEDMHSLDALKKAITGKFGAVSDEDDFLRKADLLAYDGTRAMFEAFRVNFPKSTGIVQWMLNSAWPSLYWQLYDFYGQPTASYYGTKNGNAPVQLIYNYADGCVWAINETLEDNDFEGIIELYKTDGSRSYKASRKVHVVAGKPVKVLQVPARRSGCTFLQLSGQNTEGEVFARNSYVLPQSEDVHDWKHSSWYETPIITYSDMSSLDRMRKADVGISARLSEEMELTVTLSNNSSAVAFFARLSVKDKEGKLLCPALWEDNYLTLSPGESRTISCTIPLQDCMKIGDISVTGWNFPEKKTAVL